MERKKLLWLSHLVPYPPKGGVLQRSFNLLREISKYFDVYLFCFNQKHLLESCFPNSKNPLLDAQEGLQPYVKKFHVFDIPYTNLRFGKQYAALKALLTNQSYTQEWLKSDEAARELRSFIQNIDLDLVHFDTISLAVYKDLMGQTPAILNHHNIESKMLFDRALNSKSIISKRYFKFEGSRVLLAERSLCHQFDLNITCSDDDANELKLISPQSKIKVVPNGVDVDYFYPRPQTRPKANCQYLIFAGGLSWYPNLDAMNYFIDEIWPSVKKTFPHIKMSIVGRNPPKRFIELSKNDPNLTVHGFVDDVRPLLWDAIAYICPIRDGGGTKLKILDALAVGIPLIAQRFACKGIKVEENKHVLYADSPQEYATQIQKLIHNDDLRTRLIRNGPEFIKENFSFTTIGWHYSRLINDLLRD